MIGLLKKSDRMVLFVGLFLGLIALAHPYLKSFLSPGPTGPDLSRVNGRPVTLEEVRVKVPEFVERGQKVDLNRAGEERLTELPGIGPVLAGRIIAYREEHGDFSTPAELEEVSGIGPSTLEGIRDRLKAGE
jgi:competence protein ComEA